MCSYSSSSSGIVDKFFIQNTLLIRNTFYPFFAFLSFFFLISCSSFFLYVTAMHQHPVTMLITPHLFFSIIHHSAISVILAGVAAFCYSACYLPGSTVVVEVRRGRALLPSSTKKWLFSVIWLSQIRGLSAVVRRRLLQKIRQFCRCCLSHLPTKCLSI